MEANGKPQRRVRQHESRELSPPVEHNGPFVGAPPQRVDPKVRHMQRESYRQYLHALERAEREER